MTPIRDGDTFTCQPMEPAPPPGYFACYGP
jgi:hypothetical protein